uniref:Ig-like domain-containing protein n=1 Tax=Dicentrarchus labrax TaxID=13489 RepID=A0A8P4GLG9_DICLA
MKSFTLCLLCFPGFSCCLKIHQPPAAFSHEGDTSVTLQCEQDNEEYLYMYWYRHTGRGGMQLLTYSINKEIWTTEAPFNTSKYTMARPVVLSSALHIQHVEAADSAVYYCASSLIQFLTLFNVNIYFPF